MPESAEQEERTDPGLSWEPLLYPLALALALILRLLQPGAFTSWTELSWAFRVARFAQALSARNLAGADPAGTVVAWVGSAGLALRQLWAGPGSLTGWQELAAVGALDPHNLAHLRLAAPVWLGAALAVAVFNALLVVLLAVLVAQVWGARAGLLAGLLLAASPCYLARSRMLGPDAVTAALAVAALLALLWALQNPRARARFLLSGALAGLALLNQGLAAIVAAYALLLLVGTHLAERRPATLLLRNASLWAGALVAGALLPYPATWADPLSALQALAVQATGAGWGGTPAAPLSLGLRLAPLSLAGLALLALRLPVGPNRQRLPGLALLAGALVFWRLAPAEGPDGHQALTAVVALEVAAAAGLEGVFAALANAAQQRWQRLGLVLSGALGVLLLAAVGWQAWAVAAYRPYFGSYRNPLVAARAPAVAADCSGGLERAAAYLNAQPGARELRVATSDMPALAPFFAGETVPLTEASRLTADYVVLSPRDWLQPDSVTARVLQGEPRHVVSLPGGECVRIYANDIHAPVIELLRAEAEPDDIVILDAPSPFAAHYDGPARYEELGVLDVEQAAARLNELATGRWRLWHVAFQGADSQQILAELLESQAVLLQRREMPGVTVSTYLLPLEVHFAPLTADRALGLELSGGLRLERAGLADARVQYRQKVTLALHWRGPGTPVGPTAISLRLADGEGRVWGQRDMDLTAADGRPTGGWGAEEEVTSVHSLAVPAGAPPGPYYLQAVFYTADTHQTLLPRGPEGCCRGEVVSLLPLEIEPAGAPPTVAELGLQHPLQRAAAEGLELLGYELGAAQVETGQELALRLWWRATAPLTMTYQVRLMLVDAEGALRGERTVEPAGPHYPTAAWTEGEVIEGRYRLPVDREAAGGEAIVGVELAAPHGPAGEAIRLGAVQVAEVEHIFQPPPLQRPRQETLGQAVRLLGYDLEQDRVQPGQPLRLTLYWQCLAPMRTSYTVFTHLLDPQGQLVAGHDALPAGGSRPTPGWLLHEVFTDPHEIVVPADAPPGSYGLEVGLYDAATWARLPAFDAAGAHLEGDRILLGTVTVER